MHWPHPSSAKTVFGARRVLVGAKDDNRAIGLLPTQLDSIGPSKTMLVLQPIPNHWDFLGIQRDESEVPEHPDHGHHGEQPPGPRPDIMKADFHRHMPILGLPATSGKGGIE